MSLHAPLPFSIRQLQYLIAVAELGGFRRAAEACGVAQPSMSAQIAQVEHALGVQIFERGARGVRTTAAGAQVIERARTVLLASRDLLDTARQHRDPLSGAVRIGVIPTVCPYLLPEIAPALKKQLPNLHVVWSEDKTQPLLDQIDAAALDGAILALDPRIAHLDHALIADDPFVLAAAPQHPLAKRSGPASPDVLDGQTVFLLEDGHCFRDQALAVCGATGANEADLKATGLATLVQMVGGGAGVTLLPKLAIPVENRRGQLSVRAFKSPVPTRRLVLAWRKQSALTRPLGALAKSIRAAWPGSRSSQ